MAYTYRNLAYNLTLFEDGEQEKRHEREASVRSRGKREQEGKEVQADARVDSRTSEKTEKKIAKKVKKIKRRKSNFGMIILSVIFGIAIVVTVVSIIHGQVQLTELNQQIVNAKEDLSEKQSLYTQLEMKVDSSISTAVVEQYAQEKLNMSKASNSQKEFINLSEGDKAEVSLDSHKNVFELIADAISSLWS